MRSTCANVGGCDRGRESTGEERYALLMSPGARESHGESPEIEELRARVAREHFGDSEYADVLRNQTEDGLRNEAERLRERGLGPNPRSGSPSLEAECFRLRRRDAIWSERIFGRPPARPDPVSWRPAPHGCVMLGALSSLRSQWFRTTDRTTDRASRKGSVEPPRRRPTRYTRDAGLLTVRA